MRKFNSAEEAVSALSELIELHGGKYNLADGLPGLRDETQHLWVPRKDGKIVKVPDMDVPALDSEYSDSVRRQSWALLGALGCTDWFVPLSDQYVVTLAHGTIPPYAGANFQWIIDMTYERRLDIGDRIFMLSAPYMQRDSEKRSLADMNAALVPEYLWR